MTEQWLLTEEGREHVVTVDGSFNHRVVWEVDGEEVAAKKSTDEKVQLAADDLGLSLGVWFSFSGAAKRVTLFQGEAAQAALGVGGTDLVAPEGSYAEKREARIRANPRRHEVLAVAGGVGKVLGPIIGTAILIWLARLVPWPDLDLPSIPLPDLPSIPWPDLPSIPWPDLPSIPWPDWSLPGWLRWLLDNAKYVVPVIIAYVVARAEIRRRRQQDERREQTRTDDTDV